MDQDHPRVEDFRFNEDRRMATFTCRHVWEDRMPILRVAHDADGSWQFLCGADHSADAATQGLLLCLEEIVGRDATVNDLADMCTSHVAKRETVASRWAIEDETEQHIRSVIAEHGWWVGLIQADDEGPGFAYTIGLYETFRHPEIIVFGLPPATMHEILNGCGDLVRGGTRFEVAKRQADVLSGFDVEFRELRAPATYSEYLGYGKVHYGGDWFPVMQLVWPDREGKFPMEDGAAAARAWSPR